MKKKILFVNLIYTDGFDKPMSDYISSVKGPNGEVDVISLNR